MRKVKFNLLVSPHESTSHPREKLFLGVAFTFCLTRHLILTRTITLLSPKEERFLPVPEELEISAIFLPQNKV